MDYMVGAQDNALCPYFNCVYSGFL